jgi:hypothetical protein
VDQSHRTLFKIADDKLKRDELPKYTIAASIKLADWSGSKAALNMLTGQGPLNSAPAEREST